jgi:Resolvase, N terminal domain
MTPKPKRVAVYTRVSTDNQTTVTQRQELEAGAERAGDTVVKVYEDQDISGAKGRDQRPQFDALLKGAIWRDFNMIAVWSADRLGRSLKHLVELLGIVGELANGRDDAGQKQTRLAKLAAHPHVLIQPWEHRARIERARINATDRRARWSLPS